MDKYAVAILNFFKNDNKVYITEGESESEAMLKGIIEYNKTDEEIDEDILEWVESMENKSVDEIIEECFDGDLAVSKPVKIE